MIAMARDGSRDDVTTSGDCAVIPYISVTHHDDLKKEAAEQQVIARVPDDPTRIIASLVCCPSPTHTLVFDASDKFPPQQLQGLVCDNCDDY